MKLPIIFFNVAKGAAWVCQKSDEFEIDANNQIIDRAKDGLRLEFTATTFGASSENIVKISKKEADGIIESASKRNEKIQKRIDTRREKYGLK
jgi:hypothetical protein